MEGGRRGCRIRLDAWGEDGCDFGGATGTGLGCFWGLCWLAHGGGGCEGLGFWKSAIVVQVFVDVVC